MENAVKWLGDNLLTVNIDKTYVIPIGTQQRLSKQQSNLNIKFMDVNLDTVNSIKYLGVTIDSNLSWNDHVSNLCKKVSPKIELLRKLKHKLPINQLNTIYQSIIQPHFDYCISVWGHTTANNIKMLQRLQNRAARIITGMYDWEQSATELVSNMGWMNMTQRITYFTSLLVFKSMNSQTPKYLSEGISRSNNIHYNTRSNHSTDIIKPKHNLQLFKSSFLYSGPNIWNSLPISVKESPSLLTFKTRMKDFISAS